MQRVYYGYRYYSPSTGRWLSRDPIEVKGGVHLYGMVGNGPMNKWDVLGMCTKTILIEKIVGNSARPHQTSSAAGGETYHQDFVPIVEIVPMVIPVPCGSESSTMETAVLSTFNVVASAVGGMSNSDMRNYGSEFVVNLPALTWWQQPSTGTGSGEGADQAQLKKDCEGLAGIIAHFKGEAGKALDLYNNHSAFSRRVAASFRNDNLEFLNDGTAFIGDMGGDFAFNWSAGRLLPGGVDDIAGELKDSVGDSRERKEWSTLGHLTLATYLTANHFRPTIYRSPNFGNIAKNGGGTLLVGTIAIKVIEHFGGTVYNEWQQAGIMEQINQTTSQLLRNFLHQDELVRQFQQQWKDKGCDKH